MGKLTLDQAIRICERTLAAGRETDCKPLAVAVLDDGGHLKAFMREDNASILRFEIAAGKAWGALGLGMGTRTIANMAAERPAFVNALVGASGGRLIPVPGGVLIRDGAGEIAGAVGVTGDTSDRDEACAVAGIKAVGLAADSG